MNSFIEYKQELPLKQHKSLTSIEFTRNIYITEISSPCNVDSSFFINKQHEALIEINLDDDTEDSDSSEIETCPKQSIRRHSYNSNSKSLLKTIPPFSLE